MKEAYPHKSDSRIRIKTVLEVKDELPSMVSLVTARVPMAAQMRALVGRSRMANAAKTIESRSLILSVS
jgi:hypothetical protein